MYQTLKMAIHKSIEGAQSGSMTSLRMSISGEISATWCGLTVITSVNMMHTCQTIT